MRLFRIVADEPDTPGRYEDLPPIGAYFQGRSSRAGTDFDDEALAYLETAGAAVVQRGGAIAGFGIDALVEGANAKLFAVDAHGVFDDGPQAGLRRSDTLKKAAFDAIMIRRHGGPPVLWVTSHLPTSGVCADVYLPALAADVFDIVAVTGDFAGHQRLAHYFSTVPPPAEPLPAPWRTRRGQLDLFKPEPH